MGNCTSKKSKRSAKLSALKKPIFRSEMNKDQDSHTKGLSIKIAPSTKGEITSYGFRKKPPSQLPIPVTLTSNGHLSQEPNEKMVQNEIAGVKSDEYQSGSSVESLCHAPYRSTPKMIRKKDLAKQTTNINPDTSEFNSVNVNNAKNIKYTFQANPTFRRNNGTNENVSKTEQTVNRFGFRQPTAPKLNEIYGKTTKSNAINRAIFLTGQNPYETGLGNTKRSEVSARSRSEGPRETFFKQTLQPANSIQSGLNNSKTSLSSVTAPPGKFTLQTSQLPRPQFAVRMTDSKSLKATANNNRKGGAQNELNSSKESSTTEDSGFESYSSANNTLEKQILILDSSPGSKVRRRLPAFKGKKLEMKIVGNKFELLKKEEENSPDVVTEISLIKLPNSNIRNSTAIINTGLVEQRTNQYLKKIRHSFNKMENDVGVIHSSKMPPKSNSKETHTKNADEGLAAESEEEKLCKDSRKSEKSSVKYLMSDGCGEGDDILPGEAMAEDLSLCLSFEEETSSDCTKNITQRPTFQPEFDVTPNTIRLDALKLSKEIKYKVNAAGGNRKGANSTAEVQNDYEKDEDTFPSDSILEQLSDLDSADEKRERAHAEKKKPVTISHQSLDKEDLGIDMDDESISKSDTDVDDNDLELNVDDKEIKDENKNCLGTASPDSPGTPTHASNSLSLSDGRDFLIDDEIADQPQLCLSESYVDCSCKEEVKTSNEKTVAGSEFVPCYDVQTNTVANEDEIDRNDNEVGKVEGDIVDKSVGREGRARLNSEGTLSPCESIASDDLMLDFETNSFEETERFDGESAAVKNLNVTLNKNEINEISSQKLSAGSDGDGRPPKSSGSRNRSTSASKNASGKASSPFLSPRSTPALDDDSIRLDTISYQNMFEDVASMKSMLLKLKRLLLESEGGLQENGRLYLECGTGDHIAQEEVTDLRRQVLFLQQQLEEREKMVQILRLEVTKSCEPKKVPTAGDNRKQTNAATQTGLDQFQQDFPHFRIFQTAPVV